uniref:Carbohydrate kinase FGGY C-terminal domain-containing protein n=1 Tax=Plectus sambesii TaxID=2011161 RepID=A0A914WJD3_9BILA
MEGARARELAIVFRHVDASKLTELEATGGADGAKTDWWRSGGGSARRPCDRCAQRLRAAPVNDDRACCGFLGLRPDTTKAVMVRALLEALAFRVFQIWNVLCGELDFPIVGALRCCGGVSRNDFVCQAIADLIGRPVERVKDESFSAALGVAFLTGLSVDLWREEELKNFVRVGRVFEPRASERTKALAAYKRWCRAVDRCLAFYS